MSAKFLNLGIPDLKKPKKSEFKYLLRSVVFILKFGQTKIDEKLGSNLEPKYNC